MKYLFGGLLLMPYILIGFVEMFYKTYKATDTFQTNMWYLALLGLVVMFRKEFILLYNLIRNKHDGTKESDSK